MGHGLVERLKIFERGVGLVRRGRAEVSIETAVAFAPRGFVFRHFRLGERVPAVLLVSNYFLLDFALYGLEPAPPGYVWIREGSDAVLVDRYTGEVVQVAYDVFY